LKIQSSDLKQKPLKVADQKRIDDAFDRYGALGKKDSEPTRYYPFITLANLIISSLTGTDWPTFCRNDPIIIQGSSAERIENLLSTTLASEEKMRLGRLNFIHIFGQ
jgi:hypothetical protein